MNGILFINNRIELNGLSREESFHLQKESLIHYIGQHHIKAVTLDPFQLNSHYTILHALYYDLKGTSEPIDCLACYSPAVLDDFINTYPARWLIIKSYFGRVLPVCP